MLSTENPPPDLCEISQLKSGDVGSDERTTGSNKQQREVDLLKSGLDYSNPLPKFSIRDYVFNTRGKNIKSNWPFSQKNLHVCLKHGAKDLLPPFQSLDCVRNPSIEERVVDTSRHSDVKYPELSDGSFLERPSVDVNLSECEEDKDFPSTTTSQSCSDKTSVPPITSSCLEPEAQYLSTEKTEFAVRECKKVDSSAQGSAKKCRLLLKLQNTAELKPGEDSTANTPVVSESMASKVCPVCKTFSSSSNTTLNAHIDQCLSGESVKWTVNSKVIKHRIKPRKTRLMVDIYETALCSTLEDLDRRNGTNWASNMGFHSQDSEVCVEEGKKTYSPVNSEDVNQESAVYIDSSGKKLRILSKLNHLSSNSNSNDADSKSFKRDRVVKLLSSSNKKKKKHTLQKLELQKNSLDGQNSCSPILDLLPDYPPHGPKSSYARIEVNDGQQKLYPREGHKEDDLRKGPITSDHIKSGDFGMIQQRVGSKHTGLKRINCGLENQLSDKSLKKLRIKSASSRGDRGNNGPIFPTSSDENPALPSEGLKRKDSLSRSHDGWTQLACQREQPGFSCLRSKYLSDKKNHLMSSKFKVKQSRKGSTTNHEHLTENLASCSNKRMGMKGLAVKNGDEWFGSSISHHRNISSEGKNSTPLKKLSLGHAISSGGRKCSSLHSKLLSVRHASGAESKKKLQRELLNSKNPRLHCTLPSDEQVVVSQSILPAEDSMVKALGNNATLMEKDSGELLKTREGDMTSKELETSTDSDSYNSGNQTDYFSDGSVPVDTSVSEEEAEMQDDVVCDPASTDGEHFVSFSKSLDFAFPGLTGSNIERVSQYYSKAYDENCPTELVFHAEQEMFCADNVGKNLVTPDNHEMTERNGDEAQGNYFVDVDPIPIPGPPGSFLPSPGRMGSEELLGHSSLTNCRIQSSDDGYEVVDMDSSGSPVSAVSTLSNSVAGRSSSISTANLSAHSQFKHETQLDITKERTNPVVEGSPAFASEDVVTEVTREVQNTHPCCCSRKDVSLQSGSLSFQETQILRRRNMTSLSVLSQEKQVNDYTDNGIHCYDLGAAEREPTPVTREDLANSPNGYTHVQVPNNSEAIFRGCNDSEFPSPSNPVLRLMGKNLMVMNNDDNPSPLTRPTQSSMMMEHPAVRPCIENGRNKPNEPNSFHHMLSRGPSMFDDMQPSIPSQQFNFNSSEAFKIPTNFRPSSEPPSHPSTAMYLGISLSDNATSTSGCNEYACGFSKIRPDARTAYDTEKVGTPVHHLSTRDSSAGEHKEIIIIDDLPESEAGIATKATHCSTNMDGRESIGPAASMLLPHDSRHVNPFYGYQVRVSPMVANRNTITANLGKWNCIPQGSSALPSSSSSASLPSSVNLRSAYFSPGFA